MTIATAITPASTEVVHVVRCAIHGLHDERTECFVCGGPVERVPMVEVHGDDRLCACGCGLPLAGMRVDAAWYSDAHRMAASRRRKSAQSPNVRVRRRPGGRQASFGPAVRVLAAFLVDQHAYDPGRAERVARNLLTLALPRRQRTGGSVLRRVA